MLLDSFLNQKGGCSVIQSAKLREEKPDAYKVVGLPNDCKAGEVKRRYWKLSLLIHPDKCTHPRAQDAFNAVSQAAKDLQVLPQTVSIPPLRTCTKNTAKASVHLEVCPARFDSYAVGISNTGYKNGCARMTHICAFSASRSSYRSRDSLSAAVAGHQQEAAD